MTPERFFGTFLSIPAEAGAHNITLLYIPRGFLPGVVMLIAGILMLFDIKRH